MDPMGHVLRSWNSLFTPWLWADSLDFLQCLGLWCSEKPTSHITTGRCSLASWDCVVYGGLAGSGKHSWFKKTIFVLLSSVALVIFNPSQLFSLVHITPWAAVLAQSRHSLEREQHSEGAACTGTRMEGMPIRLWKWFPFIPAGCL